jgi:predicted PurR-regulated permease PerM
VEWIERTLGQTPVLTLSGTAMDLLATLLLAIYLLADGPRVFAWCLSLFPPAQRPRLDTALRDGATRMQKWVAAQGLMMLIHGGSSLITFWLLGLPFFLPLGVFAGLANIIPVLGPILTLIAASVVAVTSSPGKLLGVVIFYLVYHNTEGAYLQPRIMSSAVGIPGAAVLVALMLGDAVAGIVGMLVSVPTAVLIATLKHHYAPSCS